MGKSLEPPGRDGSRARVDAGFTLIEIVIALAIVTIMTVVAYTNLQDWIRAKNASGFRREVFAVLQEARIRASSSAIRQRVVIDLAGETATLQSFTLPSGPWQNARRAVVAAPAGSAIATVTPTPGSALTSGSYGLVFHPSGEMYGQSNPGDDTTISPLTQADIQLTGAAPSDNASITVFGWTGKARID
jgi:prepilin-type N-terminal cleavage/methylation domain-containing protein